jgi:putative effector of murein hydrolase
LYSTAATDIFRYAGSFLGTAGGSGLVVTVLAWQQNSVIKDAKRSVVSAIVIGASGISGIYSSLTFRQQDAPNYVPGIIACIVPAAVTIAVAVALSLYLKKQNRLANERKKVIHQGMPNFRYTL